MKRRLLPSTSTLSAFEAVARTGSFSGAAEELSLTQGAISRQVQALEKSLNVTLFERGRQGATLTRAGSAYAAEIGPALRRIGSATLDLMTTRGMGGTFVLGLLPTFGTRWLIPKLPEFFQSNPDIRINFITRLESRDLIRDGLDAAVLIGDGDWPNATSELLMDEYLLPVCSPEVLASLSPEKPDDLLSAPLLHLRTRPNGWNLWFAAHGIAPREQPGMRFEQFSMAAQAAIAGIGVALLPKFLIGEELASGRLVPPFSEMVQSDMSYYFVFPNENADLPAIRSFGDWLGVCAEEDRRGSEKQRSSVSSASKSH